MKKKQIRRKKRRSFKKRRRRRQKEQVSLRFTPTAWAKLQFFCHRGETEISGFGITSRDDLLLVQDFATLKQVASIAHVCFDDEAVADFFDDQVDAGRRPDQFARIWAHTHPSFSPEPSGTDEQTFDRVFGSCEWAVMAILSADGRTYARLRCNTGPTCQQRLLVSVDYTRPFPASDFEAWEQEYLKNVHPEPLCFPNQPLDLLDSLDPDDPWLHGLDGVDPEGDMLAALDGLGTEQSEEQHE